MSFNAIYSMPYSGGPYYVVPIPNTYPPQQYKLPVNGTAITIAVATPTCYYHYPATPSVVLPGPVSYQPSIWYHATIM